MLHVVWQMFAKVYNQSGKEVGQTRLPAEVFGLKFNADVVHQVVTAQAANRRQPIAHTKTRAEVRGGGRKPWRQKGTGRARHGSIRSPLWKGGGITFGPRKERVWKQKINKKMKRRALLMVLSAKAREGELVVVDELTLDQPKTKLMQEILQKLPCRDSSCVIALPSLQKDVIRASRNIPDVLPMQVRDLNALDLLSYKYVVMPKEAIKVLKNTFAKAKTQSASTDLEEPNESPSETD
jgi:large subunit ribosomal protein L4